MRVVIAGGGTAGHVVPAVALAERLNGDEVSFIGTSSGAEARLVPAAGFPLATISVKGFDRARPMSIFGTGGRAAGALSQARRLLRARTPHVAVGMGGYVSLPVCLAARSLGIPVVLHEQNIVFGLANRVCRRSARRVAVSFPESLPAAGPRGVLVGNPVRRALVTADLAAERNRSLAELGLEAGRKTLLVFGGSQGARRVNEAALGLAERWRDRSDLQVLHIAGIVQKDAIEAGEGGARSGLIYRLVDFVERMVGAYAVADLALCRGGASTVAELTVVGLPAVIVPYPYHRDRQQERHAEVLSRAGAAIVLPDAETTTARVARVAEELLDDGERLGRMRRAALACGRPRAAEDLAAVVREAAA